MKAIYFFRPIQRMFDFRGVTGRAEYLTYTLTSVLVTLFLTVAVVLANILGNANWYVVAPREVLNDSGRLWDPLDAYSMSLVLLAFWTVLQIPMYALTVRRLRDQYASRTALSWLFIPFLGPAVLFGYGFVPTFHDYPVTMPDGTTIMRSQQLTDRRFRNAIIGAAVVAGGASALASPMSNGAGGMQLLGGKKIPVNRNASAFKADGSINNRTSILGGRKAHVRNGRTVKASRNKYTW